jgi:hypothetical protein
MRVNRAVVAGSFLALAMPGLVLTGNPSRAAVAGVQATFGAGDITTAAEGVVGVSEFTEFPGLPGAGSTVPLVAPFTGVITRINYRYTGSIAASVGFRIGTGSYTPPYDFTVRPATPSGADVQTPMPTTPGPALVAASLDWKDSDGSPVGVPITAGERVGMSVVGGAVFATGTMPTSTGGNILFANGNITSGTVPFADPEHA